MKRRLLILALVGLAGWYLWQKTGGQSDIQVHELQAWLEAGKRLVLIDVREPEEFAKTSIPGSISIPLNQLDSAPELQLIAKNQTIVVICHSGSRSLAAQKLLREKGYKHVYNLAGGITQWESVIQPD